MADEEAPELPTKMAADDDLPPPPPSTTPGANTEGGEENTEKSRGGSARDDDVGGSLDSWASRCEFLVLVFLLSSLLVGALTLVIFWIFYFREGVAWRNPEPTRTQQEVDKLFNLHPILMVGGFVFFSGFSMMFYRLFCCCKKIYVKLLHTIFHVLAIPCIVLGFITVLDSHNLALPPVPNFYSLHSWIGLTAMGLFALQFVVGFFSFLILLCCESATEAFRAALVPIHATFGTTTFVVAVAACVTGLTQKIWFIDSANQVPNSFRYQDMQLEGIIVNAMGAAMIAAAILLLYLLRIRPTTDKQIEPDYLSERL